MLTIFGISLYGYGLMLGLGLLAFWWMVGKLTQTRGITPSGLDVIIVTLALGALIGARAYHVIDLWEYYQTNPGKIVAVWEGGLGIYGAILGGVVATGILWRVGRISRQQGWLLLDAAAVGMPIGQAIGRIGNYLNHELFGLPTTLPWGVKIPVSFRPEAYLTNETFHPLFFYEAILNLILFAVLWFGVKRYPQVLGTGRFVAVYLMGYGLIRLFLEPLRIEPWTVGEWPVASIISMAVIVASAGLLVARRLPVAIVLASSVWLAGCSLPSDSLVPIQVGQTTLEVEVARTREAITQGLSDRTEIGSDGLLFVMSSRARHSFWMPRMQFDIDIVWIDCQQVCEVADITANVPKPEPGQTNLPTYQPARSVSHVLELPAGNAKEYGIETGNPVQIPANLQILP